MRKRKIFAILIIVATVFSIASTSSFAASSKSTASKYSALFTNKWYAPLQKECKQINDDYTLYPNEDERQCRWLYDGICDEFRKYREDTPARVTQYVLPGKLFVGYHFDYTGEGTYTFKKKDKTPYSKEDVKRFVINNYDKFYTFDEFYEKCCDKYTDWGWQYNWLETCSDYMRKYSTTSFFPEVTNQTKIIANNTFNKLSGAMKIYAIDKSGYFGCRFSRKGRYGMLYSRKAGGNTDRLSTVSRLKNLYKNKAKGVCHDYSNYEKTYFNSVGLKAWYRSSNKINHAWTVVKAKNSKGKILWIPFDYAIGPAERLAVSKRQKKYINTEAKRYKLYLKGIKGAPTYKNFTDADFN